MMYNLIIIIIKRIIANVKCGLFKIPKVNHLTMILPTWFKNVNLHVHHFNLVTPTFFQHNSKWIENNKITFYVTKHKNVIN
jgi:hypothetical protein